MRSSPRLWERRAERSEVRGFHSPLGGFRAENDTKRETPGDLPEEIQRWAMDVTHIPCGNNGWGHLAVVIDCCDWEIVGFEFALRARAKEAGRAIERACFRRFGTLRPSGATPIVRSDNGLIFQSRRLRAACRDYRSTQEYSTPYTPEQNGMIERSFRTLKEKCVWQHNFASFGRARREVHTWISWYNNRRPQPALGYQSPTEYRAQQLNRVA